MSDNICYCGFSHPVRGMLFHFTYLISCGAGKLLRGPDCARPAVLKKRLFPNIAEVRTAYIVIKMLQLYHKTCYSNMLTKTQLFILSLCGGVMSLHLFWRISMNCYI